MSQVVQNELVTSLRRYAEMISPRVGNSTMTLWEFRNIEKSLDEIWFANRLGGHESMSSK
ncbi:hypothetical protein ALP70_03902 [Pseudomonas savastanoi]|uniref:Uncharacterized protein n=1 Tax=Pseudomonas savastanoi TaxID=29438 RepID=A0A3M5BA43_PSESS|nr:hypothetical protein ALP70_03902 [Pseudomonas savastanoi]